MYCIHCGKELPDNSKFCNHCGSSQETVTDIQSKEPQIEQPVVSKRKECKSTKKKPGCLSIGIFLFLFFIIIMCVMLFSEETTDDKTNNITIVSTAEIIAEPELTTDTLIEITAEKLIKAYQENEIKASNQYKDKYLKVMGYVNNISRSDNVFLSDSFYVYIDDGNPYNFNDICCLLNDKSIDLAADIKPGDKIEIIGRCEGFSITSVDMYDCTIIK